ncbi:MAG: response regulator [Acidobacteriota bacterium]
MNQELLTKKILFVDDDVNILSAFQRSLRGSFEIMGALGGEKALQDLKSKGPFAVIVSDLRMPRMGGMEFLAKAYETSPQSIQMVLSGTAEISVAIEALNQGRIFRFLTKPCAPDVLAATLTAALNQYQLGVTKKSIMETKLESDSNELLESLQNLVEDGKQRIATLAQAAQPIQADHSQLSRETDPLTGLLGYSEAKRLIDAAITSEPSPRLAVFCVERMEFMRTRHGQAVADQVILLASQHLATHAGLTGDNLFRWTGAAFVALLDSPNGLDALKLELQRALSHPINQFFETMSRCVFLPIKISVDVFALNDLRLPDVEDRIHRFIAGTN